jgi:hypothetical protein
MSFSFQKRGTFVLIAGLPTVDRSFLSWLAIITKLHSLRFLYLIAGYDFLFETWARKNNVASAREEQSLKNTVYIQCSRTLVHRHN